MTKAIQIRDLMIGSGLPKICVPLTSKMLPELKEEAKKAAAAKPDLIEWRADLFEDIKNGKVMEYAARELRRIVGNIPIIFTIRTSEEGGNITIDLETYAQINLNIAKTQMVDLVDVQVFGNESEKRELIAKLKKENVFVIASSHDFDKTDSQEVLLQRFKDMDLSGADILKMAVMPKDREDVFAIMLATNEMRNNTEKPLVSMSMGFDGAITRYSGENFGSSITFGTVGRSSAPGQIPIADLRKMMESLHAENMKSERA